MHGGQRLLVFHGDRYVGQYVLSPPPYINVSVKGSQLLLHYNRESVRLDFSRKPQSKIFINGETKEFSR